MEYIFLFFSSFVFLAKVETADVTGFETAVGGSNLLKVESGGSTPVNLIYETGGTGLSFNATLHTGTTLDTSSAIIDETGKSITYTIDNSLLSDVAFGTYLLKFTLIPISGQPATKDVVVFYEEPITGFSIHRYAYIPLNEEIIFDVNFTNGTNVKTEWFLDRNETYLLRHDGAPRSLQLNFTFTVPGQHNATAIAANTVTRTFDSMLVYAYYRLNGFNITTDEKILATNEETEFVIHLSATADTPMGTLKVNFTYGDGSTQTEELNMHLSAMQGSGYIVSHPYTVQGDYDVYAVIFSEIDSVNFTLQVRVWDFIGVELSAVLVVAKVNQSISFIFHNTTPTGFTYDVDFDDGTTASENNSDIWYTGYETILLSHVYNDHGIFNVTLVAWNLYYKKVSSVLITVQYPIPGEDITLISNRTIVPIPDGILALTLELITPNPSPTNVSCTYFYVDDSYVNVSTALEYGVPVHSSHTYNTSGPRTVSVECWNQVSIMTRQHSVEVYFMLNGFNMTTSEETVASTEEAMFNITLSPAARLSMGTVRMNVSYGDITDVETVTIDNSVISTMQSTGYTLSHKYSQQGNYTFTALLFSEIDNITFILYAFIWDKINVSLNSTTIAKVKEPIEFKCLNTPPTGFTYKLDFGDGSSVSNNDSAWYGTYSELSWIHSYDSAGVYRVTLEAFNMIYFSSSSYFLFIQHPIPSSSITLLPTFDIIPLPDGQISFALTLDTNYPSPTNVTCKYDFDEGEPLNSSTDFLYGQAVEKSVIYKFPGDKNVEFTCWNLVSTMTKIAFISVRNFTLHDFNITFDSPVPMNSSANGEHDEHYPFLSYIQKIEDVPTKAFFQIDLLNCSRMPPNITFTWTFDDGSPVETDQLSSKEKVHEYQSRGNYSITLVIEDLAGGKLERTLNLTMGVVQMEVSPSEGVVNETEFEFIFSGTQNYTFNIKSNDKRLVRAEKNTYVVQYMKWGVYHECVFAIHGNVTEEVCLPQPLEIDYNISDTTDVIVGNTTVALPPGTVELNITTTGTNIKPFVNYTINLNDPINTHVGKGLVNISEDQPFTYGGLYKSLGAYEIEVNCTNFVSTFTRIISIEVVNDCFEVGGIFDRKYTDYTTPMKVYTSSDVDLSSRMQVNCEDVQFRWTVHRVEIVDGRPNQTSSLLPPHTLGGTMRIDKGSVSQGLASVTLVVSSTSVTPSTEIEETMYIEFKKLPPVAFVVGGSKRSVRFDDTIVILDALQGSYDSEEGYSGDKSGLNFTWNCYKVNTSNEDGLEEVETMYNNGNYEGCLIEETVTEPGIGYLNLTTGTDTQGYIVTVTVMDKIDRTLNTSFTQLLKAIPGNPPNVMITCAINCQEKVAVTSQINLRADCDSCTKAVSHSWSLYLFNETHKTYSQEDDFQSMTVTGLNQASMVIKAGSLTSGRKYSLKLKARYVGESQETTQIVDMTTNYPPYNGKCRSDKKVYKAPLDMVAITCEGWVDEGSYQGQDLQRDRLNSEPLTYLYETRTRKMGASGSPEVVSAALYNGGESSVTGMPVQVGDVNFDYSVEIRVLVFDRFGDSGSHSFNITVKPDDAIGGNSTNTSALAEMFTAFDGIIKKTEKGGNPLAVVRLCGSMASVLGPPTSENSDGSGTSNTSSSDTGVFGLYKNKTRDLSSSLTNSLNDRTVGLLKASDAQQITRNLEAIVGNPEYMSDEIALNSSEVTMKVIEKVLGITETKPFPVEAIVSISGAVEGTMATMDKLLETMMPKEIVDVDEDFSVDSLYEDLLEQEQGNITVWTTSGNFTADDLTTYQETLRQRAQALYDVKMQKIQTMNEKATSANESVPHLMDSLGSMYDINLKMTEVGAERTDLVRDTIKMGVEKVALDVLTNRTDNRALGDVKLSFSTADGKNSSETAIEIKQAVFEKPPFIAGKGVGSLRSKAVQVVVSDDKVVPDVSIPNPDTVYPSPVRPTYTAGDPEDMFYISYTVRNDDDFTILYVKPDDFEPFGSDTPLYHLYVQANDIPTSSSHIYSQVLTTSNWEKENGMKIILPAMTKGKKYLGFKPQRVIETTTSKRRRKRSAGIQPTTEAPTTNSTVQPREANISLVVFTTGCRSWDATSQSWVSNGCQVLPFSTLNETVCRCPRIPGNSFLGTIFATTFYVPPNTIDFATVFGKFDPSNASVYATCIALIVLWVIAVILLRREDKKDQRKWATLFLCDSDVRDSYFYLITVETGMRRGAGTKSKVNLVLTGEDEDSGVRVLDDGIRKGFPSGSARKFFMGTSSCLGPLTYLRIWHDNTGTGNDQSWYLNQITVDDPQKNERYVFLCDRWMALEEDDGQVERILPVCGQENIAHFNTLFFQHTQFNLTENHLWLSLLMRPKRSSFTRVQRATCILALLFLTMISNAMFYRSSDDDVTADTVSLGSLKFSSTIIFVSFIGIIITTPPILIVTMIFKKSKPNPKSTEHFATYLREVAKDKKKRKYFNGNDFFSNDHLPLPHWTVNIAWIILFLAVSASAFFLLLYSMQWGTSKSEEWLSSFVFSFVESLVFVDPLKVVAIALVFAILFRRPVEITSPKINIEKVKEASKTVNAGSTRTYMNFWNDILTTNKRPSTQDMEKLRRRRQQELRATGVLVELVLYGILIFSVFGISYVNRDQRSYNMKEYIMNSLYYHNKTTRGFESISGIDHWKDWVTNTFFPVYFPTREYNNDDLGARERLFYGDIANVRVGPARLRQVRMKKGECMYKKLTWPYPCLDPYNQYDEDQNNYCINWQTIDGGNCNSATDGTASAWTYTNSEDIWGTPVTGEYGTYSGGGYIVKFSENSDRSEAKLQRLLSNNWIERGTRAVFLEFTLYSANANLFVFVQFIAEFTEIGGVFTWFEIQAFRPVGSLGGMGAFALVCYGIFIVYIIYSTIKSIFKIKKHGCCYFVTDVWNIVDLICTFLSCSLIVIFGFRMSYANKAVSKYYDELAKEEQDFINFQHIVIWDNVFNYVLAILVFIITLRVLRILGYNKRLTEVASVITHASRDLIGFCVLFGIVYTSYICLGYLLFGSSLKEYRSLSSTWGSLTNALIGKNSFDKIVAVSPQMAQFYYFTYVFCVLLTLATMFAAILNRSISEVKEQSKNAEEEIGITDVLLKSLKSIVGISWKSDRGKESRKGPKKYAPNPEEARFDTMNILRLVRETFREYGDKECHQQTICKAKGQLDLRLTPSLSRDYDSEMSNTDIIDNGILVPANQGEHVPSITLQFL